MRMSVVRAIMLAVFAPGFVVAPPLVAPPLVARHVSAIAAEPEETAEARAERRRALFAALKSAPNEVEAKRIENEIWLFWTTGPNDEASKMLADAMARRQSFDFAGALAMLDILVEAEPEWSEAWNQRAFVRFLREEYEASLADIERTLALEPKHFGALAGKADILFRLGEVDRGQEALREAVAIHPWLAMRALLTEPPGRDI